MPRPRVSIGNYRFKLRNGPLLETREARLSGGSPREGVHSEARAEQRLAAGGCKLPRSVLR
jgi:hypothetical protein